MADRMAVLSHGKIGQIGTPEEIYRQPRSAYVAQFIGETNIISSQFAEFRAGYGVVKTDGGPLIGRVSDPAWIPSPGEAVRVSIRPEAWRLKQMEGENVLAGTVLDRTYLGQRIQYEIGTAAGRQQVVEMNPQIIHETGANLSISCRHDDVVILKP